MPLAKKMFGGGGDIDIGPELSEDMSINDDMLENGPTGRELAERRAAEAKQRLRKPYQPNQDGPGLDQDFSDRCRKTIAMQRGAMLAGTSVMVGGRPVAFDHSPTARPDITTTPQRMLGFLAGEGAVYSQYDLSRREYSGGALPKPWKAVQSKTTGRTYYFNPDTEQTTWEPPLYPLDKDWVVEHSPQSGAVYYVHRETGKWQWDRPVDQLFLDLLAAGHADLDALTYWRQRNEQADLGLAGLEDLPSAQLALAGSASPAATVKALPALLPEAAAAETGD